jgi:hypothetical protein
MRRKSIPPPIIRKQRPRPRTDAEHVLTVTEFFDSSASSHESALKPMIRIRGHWLAKMGFRAGEYVIVTAEPNRLVLTVAGD